MMNLFDIMQQAQNGQGMQNIARQFGLSQQQAQAAIEALLPAFSMGLQRQTQDPYAFGSLAQMMTANPYARMFDSSGDGIPNQAQGMGNTVLGQLFGSKEVSNAVAAQAAATTGVGQAILKQMLPVIAAMLMGGLSKSASNRGLDGFFGQFAEMMSGKAAQPQAQANPVNPLDAILGGFFGNAGQPPQQPQPQPQGGAMGGDAFGGMLGQILSGMMGGAQPGATAATNQPREQPREQPAEEPTPGEPGPGALGLDALNQMFEHGRKVQDQHQNALKDIFDSMLGGPRR